MFRTSKEMTRTLSAYYVPSTVRNPCTVPAPPESTDCGPWQFHTLIKGKQLIGDGTWCLPPRPMHPIIRLNCLPWENWISFTTSSIKSTLVSFHFFLFLNSLISKIK